MTLIEEGRQELGDHDRIGKGARFFDADPKTERIDTYNNWKNRNKNKSQKTENKLSGILILKIE